MEQLTEIFESMMLFFQSSTNTRVILVGVGIVIGVVLLLVIGKQRKMRKARLQLATLEARFAASKGTPLLFKLNKAVAMARINEQVNEVIDDCKLDFERVQDLMKQVGVTLGEVDDYLYVRKPKKAFGLIENVALQMDEIEEVGDRVLLALNYVLQQEHNQREQINIQKEEFRVLRKYIQEHEPKYNEAYPIVEEKLAAIEKKFSLFEEWMFAAEFEKANIVQSELVQDVAHLQQLKDHLPILYEKAKGVLPALIEHHTLEHAKAINARIYVDHIEIPMKIEQVRNQLYEDVKKLQKGDIEDVMRHLMEGEEVLQTLGILLQKEVRANEQCIQEINELDTQIHEVEAKLIEIRTLYDKVKARFGFECWEDKLSGLQERYNLLADERIAFGAKWNEHSTACSLQIEVLIKINEQLNEIIGEVNEMKVLLENACSDENRAQKQLVKLQVILNEIKVSIHKHHLPSISDKYQEDLEAAHYYVNQVVQALECTPLEVDGLNGKVKVAIDFVYKLYNNVNNLVGIASLAEETITLGNRYRKVLPDVDSQLTRSELCFRNGEYTKALKIAVATIEKIHPGAYEKILEKSTLHA